MTFIFIFGFSFSLLYFSSPDKLTMTDYKLTNWPLTIWTFDFNPPQYDNLTLDNLNFCFQPTTIWQVMAAWLPSTVTKGFSRISLVAWGEIIFEWKVVKKVSFVQTKLQLCQSYLRRGSRLPPAAFEWWRGSPLSSSGCAACLWTPDCSHRSEVFNEN